MPRHLFGGGEAAGRIGHRRTYTDAVHIADGVVGLKQRSLARPRATPLREHPTAPTPVS